MLTLIGRALLAKSLDDCRQSKQRLVDEFSLLGSVAGAAGHSSVLRAGEVDEVESGNPYARILEPVLTLDLQTEDRVRPRALLVHVGRAHVTMGLTTL